MVRRLGREKLFDSVCVSTGFGEAQFLRIGLKPILKEPNFKEISGNEFPFEMTAFFHS